MVNPITSLATGRFKKMVSAQAKQYEPEDPYYEEYLDSATNTNKRRKEEATKIHQLQAAYGETVLFVLFLCGYFGSDYLGYEAAEGIDWVWEHRIDDLVKLGL